MANGPSITGFARDQNTGGLTALADSPFALQSNAQSLAVDASGGYLYVVDDVKAAVGGYSIDKSTGALTAVAGSPFALAPGTQAGVIVTSQ